MRALVTGASGFLGGHLVRLLVRQGHQVRVFVRPRSDLTRLCSFSSEIRRGELTDRPLLRAALDGCDAVFHLAARHRLWERRPDRVLQVNVEGTRFVLAAVQEAACGRLVYVSDEATIGREPDDRPATEKTRFNLHAYADAYVLSKVRAEELVLAAARAGTDAVIVNPGFLFGADDPRPSPSGGLIHRFLTGRLGYRTGGGCFAACVTDAALGLLRAWERGVAGQRYLVGTRDLPFEELLVLLARLSGRPLPARYLPFSLALLAGSLQELWARSLGERAPALPRSLLRRFVAPKGVDPAASEKQLGLTPRPLAEGLEEAIAWCRQQRGLR
ncbi:MAG: NAD-dependent epimerase/dehydratase family protein [Myxococcota bacterium]|jgi:dihydroflavonol-4-reductase|nr:NAD-dependent epimerase/dehydratase family protein [Myxococcota bacterium]